MIESGRALLDKLDDLGMYPEAVAWVYDHALGDWRFYVASGFVDTAGRRKVYGLLLDALEALGLPEGLSAFDIHLESPRGKLFKALSIIKTGEHAHARFKDCRINGIQFDGLIYRMNPTRPKAANRKQLKQFETGVQRAVQNA